MRRKIRCQLSDNNGRTQCFEIRKSNKKRHIYDVTQRHLAARLWTAQWKCLLSVGIGVFVLSTMKLNLFKRSMIFATFFGSCLCIALIVASLGTTQWIDARAKRTSNPLESEGRISFGLFEGHKELNVGYGWRNRNFSGEFLAFYLNTYANIAK